MVRGSRFVRDFEIYLLNVAFMTKLQALDSPVFPKTSLGRLMTEFENNIGQRFGMDRKHLSEAGKQLGLQKRLSAPMNSIAAAQGGYEVRNSSSPSVYANLKPMTVESVLRCVRSVVRGLMTLPPSC